MAEPWKKISHIIPASYPRGCHRGLRDPQTSRLKLHISQYIPNNHASNPLEPAVTLIVQHGMPPGDNSACLEPFISDLLSVDKFPVRSIWAMDIVSSGRSFLLNKDEIGDQHDWSDAARDILQMVNHFQTEMKAPMFCLGQSWGNVPLVTASSWSPQLFRGLIISEPVFETGYRIWKELGSKPEDAMGIALVGGLYRRRTVWDSREEIREWYLTGKGKHIGTKYDPRVVEKIIENDYIDRTDGKVELISPPSQTAVYFVRGQEPAGKLAVPDSEYERRLESQNYPPGLWAPAWSRAVYQNMEALQPKVLLLWGSQSPLTEIVRKTARESVGVGARGAGGLASGQVTEVELDSGHSLPLYVPKMVANTVAPWLSSRYEDWLAEQEARKTDFPIDPKSLPKPFHEALVRRAAKI